MNGGWRRRGLSLVEALFAFAIIGLLLTTASVILVRGLDAWSQTTSRSQEEDSVLVSLAELENGVLKTDANSLVLFGPAADPIGLGPATEVLDNSPGSGVSFLASDDTLPMGTSGFTQWTHFEIWYQGPDPDVTSLTGQALWRQRVTLPAVTSNPNPYQLTPFTPQASDQRMLFNLVALQVVSQLQASVLSGTSHLRVSPVQITVQLKWRSRLLQHTCSLLMLDNSSLEPPFPVGP